MALAPPSSRATDPSAAVDSVFGRTGAVVAVNADYMGVVASALTGATQASRYAGATASGSPTSGTFAIGDFVIDRTGRTYICTVAGTPGTWVTQTPTLTSAFAPTGARVENVPRLWAAGGDAAGPASGTLLMTPIWLPQGFLVTSISFVSGGTAALLPTNQWFALYNASTLALLRQTTDDLTTAWASDAIKTLALTSTFTTTYDGEYFVAFMVAATTVPSLRRASSLASGALRNLAPVPWGTSTSGLTTTAPNPAAALSTGGDAAYCYVS